MAALIILSPTSFARFSSLIGSSQIQLSPARRGVCIPSRQSEIDDRRSPCLGLPASVSRGNPELLVHRPHLALSDELRHRSNGLFDRSIRVHAMLVVEVNGFYSPVAAGSLRRRNASNRACRSRHAPWGCWDRE